MARNHNVVPFADLSTMPPRQLTELMMKSTRLDVLDGQDRAFWKSVHDSGRAARAEAMSAWWSDVSYAVMFTIEDRLAV